MIESFTAKDALALSNEYLKGKHVPPHIKQDMRLIDKWVKHALKMIKSVASSNGQKRIKLSNFPPTKDIIFNMEVRDRLSKLGFTVYFSINEEKSVIIDWSEA